MQFTITAASNPTISAAEVFTNPNTKAAALANLTSAPPIPFLVTAADKSIIKSIAAKAKISFTSSDGSLGWQEPNRDTRNAEHYG